MFSIVLYPSINKGIYLINRNRIGGAKVGRLECKTSWDRIPVKSKSIMLVFAASLLRTQYWSKSKDRWARNPVDMSECSDKSTRLLLFQ
jgi:hypothetical protein